MCYALISKKNKNLSMFQSDSWQEVFRRYTKLIGDPSLEQLYIKDFEYDRKYIGGKWETDGLIGWSGGEN